MDILNEKDQSIEANYEIGALDFSEAVASALLLDQVYGITCTIHSATLSKVKPLSQGDRPYRNCYYDVFEFDRDNLTEEDEKKLQESINEYGMQKVESIQSQIEEDKVVEQYWSKLFDNFLALGN